MITNIRESLSTPHTHTLESSTIGFSNVSLAYGSGYCDAGHGKCVTPATTVTYGYTIGDQTSGGVEE